MNKRDFHFEEGVVLQTTSVEGATMSMRAGKLVILVDDQGHAMLTSAASCVTSETINFMATFGGGLVCLALPREACERLELPPMTDRNGSSHGKAFTVSIEAARGVTTGISAADRAYTISTAVAAQAIPLDLVHPGHIFPIQVMDGGVLARRGAAEACSDLVWLAGNGRSAVMCDVLGANGDAATIAEINCLAELHDIGVVTLQQVLIYRAATEDTVVRRAVRTLNSLYGQVNVQVYQGRYSSGTHLALSFGPSDEREAVPVIIRDGWSILDAMQIGDSAHLCGVKAHLSAMGKSRNGVLLLLNCAADAESVATQVMKPSATRRLPDSLVFACTQMLIECGVFEVQFQSSQPHLVDLEVEVVKNLRDLGVLTLGRVA